MARSHLSAALFLALAVSGCHAHASLDTPREFVELEGSLRTGHDVRAITADGVALQARVEENHGHGTLAFWAKAAENRLRRGGYAILGTHEVRTSDGKTGSQLRCALEENGRPYDYWITLFVTDDWITIVEAGGRRDQFEPLVPEVERAIASVRTR